MMLRTIKWLLAGSVVLLLLLGAALTPAVGGVTAWAVAGQLGTQTTFTVRKTVPPDLAAASGPGGDTVICFGARHAQLHHAGLRWRPRFVP